MIQPVFAEIETAHRNETISITESNDTAEPSQSLTDEISVEREESTVSKKWFVGDLIISVLLAGLVVFLLLRIRNIKNKIGKFTDLEIDNEWEDNSENIYYDTPTLAVIHNDNKITESILNAFGKK